MNHDYNQIQQQKKLNLKWALNQSWKTQSTQSSCLRFKKLTLRAFWDAWTHKLLSKPIGIDASTQLWNRWEKSKITAKRQSRTSRPSWMNMTELSRTEPRSSKEESSLILSLETSESLDESENYLVKLTHAWVKSIFFTKITTNPTHVYFFIL